MGNAPKEALGLLAMTAFMKVSVTYKKQRSFERFVATMKPILYLLILIACLPQVSLAGPSYDSVEDYKTERFQTLQTVFADGYRLISPSPQCTLRTVSYTFATVGQMLS